ncbi:hypothetical protein Cob_v008480 [Colletotrichum orbiculare MAFF 240422]|uniref:Uncharacterized protein n=1 Tax=Colletotrichum orbiculare (strain 104-T / ATCC 96160 / CBS 514.97 / LARS 414 / MAFF 240422) TaxID=1213857 RepID=A0A484FKU0_COLOR|nr:hypothetical protein Cob_v008480 [Colletotrichum orbiculare MAFF 240422]
MLSERLIGLDTLTGNLTLFELAAACLQPSICRFLVEQNPKLCLEDNLSRPDAGMYYRYPKLSPEAEESCVADISDIASMIPVSPALEFRSTAFRLNNAESYWRYSRIPMDRDEKSDFTDAAWDAATVLDLSLTTL